MKAPDTRQGPSASEPSASDLITKKIAQLGDWRGETLGKMRKLIRQADPDVVEEWKWVKPTNPGTPVWSHDGIVCTGETYKSVVKLTFAKGAALKDPIGLFNASLEGNVRRAIDIREGETIDAAAFKALFQEAVALNGKTRGAKNAKKALSASHSPSDKPALLAGGNPQIAKGDGDKPVQAYIAAMPGWKRAIGHRIDALVTRTVPNVRKGVRWNSPFYGADEHGWFLNFHCFTRFIKVAFFRGTSLRPVPPVESKQKEVRYVHIGEDGIFDEVQFVDWVQQARRLPGERM